MAAIALIMSLRFCCLVRCMPKIVAKNQIPPKTAIGPQNSVLQRF